MSRYEEDAYFTEKDEQKPKRQKVMGEPTAAFQGSSWLATLVGVGAYLIGLFNADTMMLNEKGYYFAILIFGLYAAVSLQKVVRDKEEDIAVTGIYYGISWLALVIAVALLVIGLYNAGSIVLSEKGFYAMAYTLSLFGSVAVQKNIRDVKKAKEWANID